MKCQNIKDFFNYINPRPIELKRNGFETNWSRIAIKAARSAVISFLVFRTMELYLKRETVSGALASIAGVWQAIANQLIQAVKNHTSLCGSGIMGVASIGIELQYIRDKKSIIVKEVLACQSMGEVTACLADKQMVALLLQTPNKNILRREISITEPPVMTGKWLLLHIAALPNYPTTFKDGTKRTHVRHPIEFETFDRLFDEIPWSEIEKINCLHKILHFNNEKLLQHVFDQKFFRPEAFNPDQIKILKSHAAKETLQLLEKYGL